MSETATVEIIFLLLLIFIVAFGLLARKVSVPYPIVMVIGGLILGFVPGMPRIQLQPDMVFLGVLPPLLYASAWTTSWRDFRYNLSSILLLAVGLVGFTVVGVALIAPTVFSGFDWRLGLALGAVVAPTDAIAATSIARKIGLPGRVVDILEGESLINDATGLLALQFATAILAYNQKPTLSGAIFTFTWLTIGGIAVGLVVGWLVNWIENYVDDGPIEITLSILTPYVAYFVADKVHASGVLAVVACGLYLSRKSATFFSANVRLQIWSVWQSLIFVLNGLVFVLIGLQLPAIREATGGYNNWDLLAQGAIFSAMLIVLRVAWVFPGAATAQFFRKHVQHQSQPLPRAREIFVVGWTGMRGVVSLAAALALPTVLGDGRAFPHRNSIIFLTFFVILVTLVIQGLTLPPIIKALGLNGSAGPNCEEREARRLVTQAALAHIDDAKQRESEASEEHYDHLAEHYRQRLASLQPGEGNRDDAEAHGRYLELSLELLRVERNKAVQLRNEGRINDEVLRRIERELDLSESKMATQEQ